MIAKTFWMTNIHIAIINTLCLISSCISPDEIRRRAVEHEYYGPVNNAISSFIGTYYRMPNSLAELSDYCEQYSFRYSDNMTFVDQFIDQMNGTTPQEYFSKPYVSFVSYSDSCFVYDRKHKYGCCIYGTPCYWANTDWRKTQSFSPSFFDKEGKVIPIAHEVFYDELTRISALFDNRIMRVENAESIPIRYRHQSFSIGKCDTTAFNLVLKYSRITGVEQLCSRNDETGPLLLVTRSGIISPFDGDTDINSLSKPLRDSLCSFIEKLILKNEEISEVFFIAPLFF